jgi:hypothetical protein
MNQFFNACFVAPLILVSAAILPAYANSEVAKSEESVKKCSQFGPQSPRDIDSLTGTNKSVFSFAPESRKMNLCNIHFHVNAEHRSASFSKVSDDNTEGGYQCNISDVLSEKERSPYQPKFCKGIDVGDTLEVHWVHSSCDVEPGKSLGACLSDSCANPNLRVETQVFTVVNDSSALDFMDYVNRDIKVDGYYQAKDFPQDTGAAIEYLGSTTGPKYNDQICSPMQVTWSVRPECAKVDIRSLDQWCEDNVFEEDHAHGVRKLVIDPKKLSRIK